MKNNKFIKFGFLIIISIIVASVFSCTEEITGPDLLAEKDGDPVINYIRVTDPTISDSLLVSSFLGSLIAIVGDNLGDTKELWFNDQKALLNPTYITDKTIIVNIPTSVPAVVTDQMRLVFSDATELTYPFVINVPAPIISNMKSEYVVAGGEGVIYGDFFFDPMTVTFTGGIEANIVSLEKTEIAFEIPEGVDPGPITIETNFGKATSKFHFRDDRGMILDFDGLNGGGWRSGNIQNSNPDGVSGNYVKLSGLLDSDWAWVDDHLEVDLWGQSAGRPEGPLFKGDPKDLQIKFEAYVYNPWHAGRMQFIFSPWNNSNNAVNTDASIARGFWAPWEITETNTASYQTDGWITASIPLADFIYNDNKEINNLKLEYPDNCGSLTIFVRGPMVEASDVLIYLDNVRVVPL